MFQIGEYVVHGSNGICRVNDITQLDIPGSDKNRKYYILIPVGEKGSKIYSPVESSSKIQTRKVITKKEAIQLIQEIPEIEAAWIENDKIREMVYKEALKSCDLRELVKIIKNMYLRREERFSKGKKTTILDDRYFKLAEDKLYGELSFVMGEEREQIEEKIQERARQVEVPCEQ
ncbi:MAG: CarD family transcriptional regulator [Lachnospira sp.]|nr:CarD family transcriptional regulator [Lachnospira sp.]